MLERSPLKCSSWEYQNESYIYYYYFFRVCDDLIKEEKNEIDEFLEECVTDPSLRERLSIFSRTFENQRSLVQTDSMLFLNDIFTIDPLVSSEILSDLTVNIVGV